MTNTTPAGYVPMKAYLRVLEDASRECEARKAVEAELATANAQHEQLQQRVQQLEAQLDKARILKDMDRAETERIIGWRDGRIADLEAEVNEHRRHVATVMRRENELKLRVVELERELAEAFQRLSGTEAAWDTIESLMFGEDGEDE